MKIFLDDIRQMPADFDLVFRTGEQLIQYLKTNDDIVIDWLSFDHDLGEYKLDGYDVVKLLVDMNVKVKKITFHTDNLIGLKNMYYYLTSAQRSGVFSPETYVDKFKYDANNGELIRKEYSPIR